MAWRNYKVKDQKLLFISDWLKEEMSVSELCRCYGISRKTGYKLINRYQAEKEQAFIERSRARHTISNKTPKEVIKRMIAVKKQYPYFGPEKVRDWLLRNEPNSKWPAVSTIGDIFKDHGLVKPKKHRRQVEPYTDPFSECREVNQVWSADFKGKFLLGNGKYCNPLTISDNCSRFLLACQGLYRPTLEETQACFERVFYLYGLPDTLRTDNGTPFAGTGIKGLSQLSIWLLKLGIIPERIDKGCPEQNGRHERMHRTLKEAATQPPKKNLKQQQKRFDEFSHEYNYERSHEALNKQCPGDIYTSSKRPFPSRIPEVIYPNDFQVRFVRSNGEIKYEGKKYFISELLYKEPVGLEMVNDDFLIMYFSRLKLAILDLRQEKLIRV